MSAGTVNKVDAGLVGRMVALPGNDTSQRGSGAH